MSLTIALHFHPDWPFQGEAVIEAIAASRRYRSQFETGTSNGGLTAVPGGDRHRWESRLFEGKYDDAAPDRRPVYGAIHIGEPYGPAPRFGSAYLRLRAEVGDRSTYCYPDSVFEPVGVVDVGGAMALQQQMESDDLDPLDSYAEAHVHGGVSVDEDVDAVVLDPCFRGTPIEDAAQLLGCAVEFHPGFVLDTAGVSETYRGAEPAMLARSLGAELTPNVLGGAARSGAHDPQALKRAWHLLARFGRLGD